MGVDSLYYIMDYSGNYYKINSKDQLVVASGEKEATIFTFAQANRRICIGKKAAFYCMVSIEEDECEARVSELKNPEENVPLEQRRIEEHLSQVKELVYDEVNEQAEKNISSYDLSQMDWEGYLEHFTYLVSALNSYKDELTKSHSDIDKKICDVLHYIELCETNDKEAIDLVELLRVCREKRRDIKDELQQIEYFQNNFGTKANAAMAKQALKCIKGMETRKYMPRKYSELFENCILKDRHLQKADLVEVENRQQKCEEERREATTMEEKRYTPYDGKENDWLSFARRQAEFYRNAEQYVTNLKIDIKELEEEIEKVLLEMEAVNCNVTQGYKVFRKLKELRLEKKQKSQELQCLYTLTDYMDCEALADASEEKLTQIEEIMGQTLSVKRGEKEESTRECMENLAG